MKVLVCFISKYSLFPVKHCSVPELVLVGELLGKLLHFSVALLAVVDVLHLLEQVVADTLKVVHYTKGLSK